MTQARVRKQVGRIAAGFCCAALVFALFFSWGDSRLSAKTTEEKIGPGTNSNSPFFMLK